MSYFGSTEYYLEVLKTNIAGSRVEFIQGIDRDVDTGFTEPLTDIKIQSRYPYSAVGEQWEVVSDNANDASAGTGAIDVTLTYLDDNYVEQVEVITLNGLSAVTTAATNVFRLRKLFVSSAGTSRQNEGNIILRVAGGGTEKGAIPALFNTSNHGLYTVPAGHTAYIIWALGAVPKNKDSRISMLISEGLYDIFQARIPINLYQATVPTSPVSPFGPFPEFSEFQPIAQTENNNTEISILYEVLLVEN